MTCTGTNAGAGATLVPPREAGSRLTALAPLRDQARHPRRCAGLRHEDSSRGRESVNRGRRSRRGLSNAYPGRGEPGAHDERRDGDGTDTLQRSIQIDGKGGRDRELGRGARKVARLSRRAADPRHPIQSDPCAARVLPPRLTRAGPTPGADRTSRPLSEMIKAQFF